MVANALSRLQDAPLLQEHVTEIPKNIECVAIFYTYAGWIDELRMSNEQNEWIMEKNELIQVLHDGSSSLKMS